MTKATLSILSIIFLLSALTIENVVAQSAPSLVVTFGKVQVTDIGTQRGYTNARGFGIMLRYHDTTRARILVSGLQPNLTYPAHVHTLTCAEGAGGHYKQDTTITTAVEANEIWLTFTTDANGEGSGSAVRNFLARSDAKSMIVHDPADKAKLLCVDLAPFTP